jgi:hypothetical protein
MTIAVSLVIHIEVQKSAIRDYDPKIPHVIDPLTSIWIKPGLLCMHDKWDPVTIIRP